MLSVVLLITWLAVLAPGASTQSAGIKAVFTNSGLQFISSQISKTLGDMVRGFQFPPQYGRTESYEYRLHNLQVKVTSPIQSRMRFIEGQGLELTVSLATLQATANFWASLNLFWFPISESGSLSTELSNLQIKGTVQIVRGIPNWRPSLNFLTCQASLGGMTLQVQGDDAWLTQILQDPLRNLLRGFIEQEVLCSLLRKELTQNAGRELAKIPTKMLVFEKYEVDVGLAGTPTVRSDSVESLHSGVFSRIGGTPAPLPYPSTLPPWQGSGGMVQVTASQATLASLMSVLQSHQELVYRLSSSHGNAAIVEFLTISNKFPNVGVIPGLKEQYLGRMTSVAIASDSMPEITLGGGKIHIQGTATVTLNLDPPTSTPLLQLRLDYQLRLTMTLQPAKLTVRVDGVDRLNVSVKQSAIGHISDANMQLLVNTFVKNYAIPDFNDRNRGEVPIPVSDNVDLVNIRLMIIPGAIQVATDLRIRV